MNAIPSILQSVLSQPTTESKAATDLKHAAQQQQEEVADAFESVFISLLVKQMRQTTGEEGLFAGDQSDTFGGMFDLFMGQHLAQSNDIGIDKLVIDSLRRAAENESPNTT